MINHRAAGFDTELPAAAPAFANIEEFGERENESKKRFNEDA